MAVRFSNAHRADIVATLRQAAARHAAQEGMRKTTVEELAAEAGISKGAFYQFYPSKERLFLDMLEQWFAEITSQTELALAQNRHLPPRALAALLLNTACDAMRKQPLMRFCEEESRLMLRKIPEQIQREHYQSVDMFIGSLIHLARVRLTVPEETAFAAVKILMMALADADQVGKSFHDAFRRLVAGACTEMVADDQSAPDRA